MCVASYPQEMRGMKVKDTEQKKKKSTRLMLLVCSQQLCSFNCKLTTCWPTVVYHLQFFFSSTDRNPREKKYRETCLHFSRVLLSRTTGREQNLAIVQTKSIMVFPLLNKRSHFHVFSAFVHGDPIPDIQLNLL